MSSGRVRELGAFERFRAVLHDLNFHCNVIVVARLTSDSTESSDLELLIYSALRRTVLRHPALRVAIVQGDVGIESRSFVHLSPIDLRRMVTIEPSALVEPDLRVTDEALGRYSSAGHFPEGLPPWKMVVNRYGDKDGTCVLNIAFVWHHAIGDGKSGLAALATMIEGLNRTPGRAADSEHSRTRTDALYMVHTTNAPINPPLEDLMRVPTSWQAYVWNLGKRMPRLGPFVPPDAQWAGASYLFKEPIQTKTQTIHLPTAETQALLLRCHEEGVTFTPLIQTLVGKVMLEAIPMASWLRGAVAISLRRFFKSSNRIPDTEMGLYVSAFYIDAKRTDLPRTSTRFWNQVRMNANAFKREIAKGDMDIDVGLLRGIENFTTMLKAKQGQQREKSYGITNLGLFNPENMTLSKAMDGKPWQGSERDRPQSCRWKLTDTLFTQSCHANGSAIQFCIISTQDGPLNITLNWQNGVVDDDLVGRIAARLADQLLAIAAKADNYQQPKLECDIS